MLRVEIRELGAGSRERGPTRNPEWENRADPVGLRFEWVGVERAGVVGDVQIVNPVKVSEHVTGSETDGVPFFQVVVDPLSLESKTLTRGEKVTVVIKVVDTHLEAAVGQPIAEVCGHGVWTFGGEIERRAKAQLHFEVQQVP